MISVTPTELRKDTVPEKSGASTTTLYINYKKPFDLATILSFLRLRAITGVELVTQDSYSRTFRTDNAEGFFTVTDNANRSCLELTINCSDPRCYAAVYNKVRRMFDIDTDFSIINAKFRSDPLLCEGMVEGHVPRLPVAFDPFEFVIRAILGQQISVKAATTLAGRIAVHAGIATATDFPVGLDYFFPTAQEFLSLEIDTIGVTQTRQATLRTVTQAVIDGTIRLTPNQTPETFHRDFSALKGIGDWTVSYVAMRGLGMIDSFPYSDLGVIKALTSNGKVATKKEIVSLAGQWRPYRTYATLCLWNKGQEKE
jgi:AraC family transcriptional regulator of adaptative response / DNA-3-methyladenine glycosylase II